MGREVIWTPWSVTRDGSSGDKCIPSFHSYAIVANDHAVYSTRSSTSESSAGLSYAPNIDKTESCLPLISFARKFENPGVKIRAWSC